MVMKIENYIGTADTFTWPYNPQVFDDTTDSNHTTTPIGYQKHHIIVSGGGISPKNIILTGHFSGTSKLTNWRDCSKHFMQTTQLKKLYFESDKFHLGIGKQIKRTQSGGRTNFIDYVGAFEAIVGILFGDTEKSTGTNGGNTSTFVTKILAQYDGTGDVTYSDLLGNAIKIPSTVFSGTEKILYLLVQMVNSGSGIYVSEYSWVGIEVDSGTASSTTANKLVETGQNFLTTVNVGDVVYNTTDSTYTNVAAVDNDTTLSLDDDIMASSETYVIYHQTKAVQTTDGFGILQVGVSANITDITATNTSSSTEYFRDGYTD